MSMQDSDELCPSCGKWAILDDRTGFCDNCTKSVVDSLSDHNKTEKFLKDNADHLEHLISTGLSLDESISRIYAGTRPRCACCGVFIKRAARNAIFCRNNAKCRKASRRYVYLYTERKYTKPDALAKVLSELTGE